MNNNLTERQKTMTREDMVTALREAVCKVVFTKANGDERVMNATLLKEHLANHPLTGTGDNYTNDVIRVIDTDIDEWRSFRVDSVKSFEKE